MSAHDKNGLGYGTQLNEMSDKSETDSEISMSVFEVRSSDEESTPSNDSETVDDVSEVSPDKTNETQTAKTQVDKIGQTSKKAGIGFKKIKACFVCKSTDYLIKDCDFYDKKSPEPKLKNVVNTGQTRVLTRTGLVNPVRTNGKRAVHTVSTARLVSTARPFAPKTAQTSRDVRPIYQRMDNGNPEICLQDHAVVDSGCSSHMTGNKAYLSDYEDYNGGFVAFGNDLK
ncbi:hypothetical protein Tco_1544105 [Tanacetum coccineum]